jgi:hypothetical protein
MMPDLGFAICAWRCCLSIWQLLRIVALERSCLAEIALELAQRPQSLEAVKKLSGANAYFIDTTCAAGLQQCFDPEHPLTRVDDIKWKQALSDYARKNFGVFGSECGREWAVSDFFQGTESPSSR